MNLKNPVFAILTIVLLTATTISHARFPDPAPDSGENGANRRVESPAGYGGVAGTFTLPSVSGLHVLKQQLGESRTGPCGTSNIATLEEDNPQMYLGFKPPLATDGGITWHPGTITTTGTRVSTTNRPDAHWTPFLRVDAISTCYRSLGGKFKSPRTSLIDVQVVLFLDGRSVTFSVKHPTQGTKWWSFPLPSSYYNAFYIAPQLKVKRVIAMTQKPVRGVRAPLDGSSLTGARFSNGMVYPVTAAESSLNPALFPDGEFVIPKTNFGKLIGKRWSTAGGDANHFIPFGRWGKSQTLGVPFIIQTGGRYSRDRKTGKQKRPDRGFYNSETVSIFMYNATRGSGTKATPR